MGKTTNLSWLAGFQPSTVSPYHLSSILHLGEVVRLYLKISHDLFFIGQVLIVPSQPSFWNFTPKKSRPLKFGTQKKLYPIWVKHFFLPPNSPSPQRPLLLNSKGFHSFLGRITEVDTKSSSRKVPGFF